jgi:membrane-associated PAP2 superfamily phosphatase
MKRISTITVIALITIAIASFSGLDIWIASLFYGEGGVWTYSKYPLWVFLYKHGPYFPFSIAIICFMIFLLSFFIRKLRPNRTKTIFALLLLLLAPGLIVQNLKITWGRPRPSETSNFGGKYEYRTPFSPNFKLLWNKSECNSFPSGHAAIGFYTLVLYFVLKRKKSLLALGLLYGGLMGIGRMIQGGHYFSDILASLFIVYITAKLLEIVFFRKME